MLTSFVSVIRIALRLLLSSIAMFCIWPRAIAFFLLAVTLIVYRICRMDGSKSILWILDSSTGTVRDLASGTLLPLYNQKKRKKLSPNAQSCEVNRRFGHQAACMHAHTHRI
jgi:hypothetical protein